MNTADYCPRGRELYAEWMAWLNASYRCVGNLLINPRLSTYRAYRQHVDNECDMCAERVQKVSGMHTRRSDE